MMALKIEYRYAEHNVYAIILNESHCLRLCELDRAYRLISDVGVFVIDSAIDSALGRVQVREGRVLRW
jgi:hypothetical protein